MIVRDTEATASDDRFGRGLSVQRGATAQLSRLSISNNRDLGIFATSAADVSAEDLEVSNTRPRACESTTCSGDGAGHGVGSYFVGTSVRLSRFTVAGSALCGLHLADDGELDLSDGEVRDQPIGMCLQIDGYDTARLTTGVRYDNNGVNLQSTSLPVPEPALAGPAVVP